MKLSLPHPPAVYFSPLFDLKAVETIDFSLPFSPQAPPLKLTAITVLSISTTRASQWSLSTTASAPIWWVTLSLWLQSPTTQIESRVALYIFTAPVIPDCLRQSCALFLCWHQRTKAPLTRSDSGNSDDNYVPMNPGSSPLSAAQADSPKNIYIPMSPGPHHFDFPGFSATLPARKGSSASLCHRPGRLSDVTPPPINRNLKPNRKCECLTSRKCKRNVFTLSPFSDSNQLICFWQWVCFCFSQPSQRLSIWRTMGSLMSCRSRVQSPCRGHGPCESGHSPAQLHWLYRVMLYSAPARGHKVETLTVLSLCFRPAMNSMSSQHCRPISTQSITSTDSADSEENYVAMVNLGSRRGNQESTSCPLSVCHTYTLHSCFR